MPIRRHLTWNIDKKTICRELVKNNLLDCKNILSMISFVGSSENTQPKSLQSDCSDNKQSECENPEELASKRPQVCETDSTRLPVKWVQASPNSDQPQPPGTCHSRETSVSTRDSRESSYSSGDSMSYSTTGRSTRPKNCNSSNIHFFSGNPMVEVTKGILHVYKDK